MIRKLALLLLFIGAYVYPEEAVWNGTWEFQIHLAYMPTQDLDNLVPATDDWVEYIRLNEDGTALWDANPEFIRAKPYFWSISRTGVLVLKGMNNTVQYRIVEFDHGEYLCLKVETSSVLAFLGIARPFNELIAELDDGSASEALE